MSQIEVRFVAHFRGHHDLQFLRRGDMFDDARNVGHAHLAKSIGPMASVMEDEAFVGIGCVQKVGAEPQGYSDDADKIARRRIICDIPGFQRHGAEKSKVV